MFKAKTVFVIGAGASAEVGLPVGRTLTERIAGLLNFKFEYGRITSGDRQIFDVLQNIVRMEGSIWENNNFIASAQHISEAMSLAPSIDNFVESYSENREIVLLSKLGIAKAILQSERACKLATTNELIEPFRHKEISQTWYPRLAHYCSRLCQQTIQFKPSKMYHL